jgi:LytS/YehU family sensor histidine kinase
LAENAVIHGLAGHDGRVEIHLEITIAGEELTICVRNTMAPSSVTGQQGIGIRNVRERLAVQFGDQAGMNAGPAGSGEWRAEICLPVLREVPRSRSDAA